MTGAVLTLSQSQQNGGKKMIYTVQKRNTAADGYTSEDIMTFNTLVKACELRDAMNDSINAWDDPNESKPWFRVVARKEG